MRYVSVYIYRMEERIAECTCAVLAFLSFFLFFSTKKRLLKSIGPILPCSFFPLFFNSSVCVCVSHPKHTHISPLQREKLIVTG